MLNPNKRMTNDEFAAYVAKLRGESLPVAPPLKKKPKYNWIVSTASPETGKTAFSLEKDDELWWAVYDDTLDYSLYKCQKKNAKKTAKFLGTVFNLPGEDTDEECLWIEENIIDKQTDSTRFVPA